MNVYLVMTREPRTYVEPVTDDGYGSCRARRGRAKPTGWRTG